MINTMTRQPSKINRQLHQEELKEVIKQQNAQVALLLESLRIAYLWIQEHKKNGVNSDWSWTPVEKEEEEKELDEVEEEMLCKMEEEKLDKVQEEMLVKKEEEKLEEVEEEKLDNVKREAMGEGLIQERIKKTLLLMDSHVKSINARKIEQHIGGLLFTGQVARDRRIYNSGPWENAKFPTQNLQSILDSLRRHDMCIV